MERKNAKVAEEGGEREYKTFQDENDDGKVTYTVAEAVEAIGFGRFQIKLSLIAGFSWIADSMEIMVLSILGPVLGCEWSLSTTQQALITTTVFTGFMIGAPVFGTFADKYGRKASLLFGVTWAVFYGVLSGLAPNFGWLLALRCLTGFGIGVVPQAVTYYTEFLPMKIRGKCVMLLEAFWALGAVFEVCLAMLILVTFGWRPWLVASAIPLILFIPMFLPLPESPRYCLVAGRYEEAVQILSRIAVENKASLPEGTLERSVKVKRGQLRDLFKSNFERTTVLLWLIWFLSAFTYYGLVLLSTELIRLGGTCPEGVQASENQDCAVDCQTLTQDDYIKLVWTSVAELPGLLVTAFCIDIIGRKWTLGLDFAVLCVTFFLLFICQNGSILTLTLFIGRAMVASAFQVAYVYTPEVYPTTVRAVGMGWACGWARVGAILTPFVAQVLLEANVRACLGVYAVAALLGCVCSFLLPVETLGHNMSDTNNDH